MDAQPKDWDRASDNLHRQVVTHYFSKTQISSPNRAPTLRELVRHPLLIECFFSTL